MTERMESNHDVGTHARQPPRKRRPVWPGLLVITLGVVFLLDNLDVIESERLFRFWPVILIVAGVKH